MNAEDPGWAARLDGLIDGAAQFHPWDAMAPAALAAIHGRGPFRFTAETGCGGSTIVLSHRSDHHTAFAIERPNRTLTELRQQAGFHSGNVTLVEGETRLTLPIHPFPEPLDLVLLDRPHAYPLPQLECAYLLPRIRVGGWLVLDDLQIPSVHELFRFLRRERFMELEDVVVRTAFFRKTGETGPGPDGWEHQGMNRHGVLRYCWRDSLRRLLGRGER